MNIEEFLKQLLSLGGFSDYKIEIDSEHNHGVVFIHTDPGLIKENLPIIVESLNHLLQLLTRKNNLPNFHIDVNNYRKERENLIAELAKATARKVVATKQEVPLPAMNSYERRIAHMELAAHPEVKTESVGKGAGRCVIVKPIT
ncbi:MAG TPA: R3H domain-containing nucleic acid-binding protein [Candidatus Paceibacterota bacterium]